MRIGAGFRQAEFLIAVYPLTQVAILAATPEQDGSQFIQCLCVYLALEFDNRIQRHPIVAPAPGIEFRRIRGTEADVGIPSYHSQQKPDLFLPLVVTARISTYKVARYVVAQPVPRPPQYAYVLWEQAYFLMQFPIHGLYRTFAILDAALRELPGMFPYALAPENLILVIY